MDSLYPHTVAVWELDEDEEVTELDHYTNWKR